MNDDTPDWRDDRPGDEGSYERPRQEPGRGADRRASDPRFTDTRPPSSPDEDYGAARDTGAAASRASSPRERLSADYDDEPVFRRRSAGAGGGLSALLGSDVMTRRLVYGAAGLGALLVLGVGGWSLLGGHSSGIPVIGPPPGPVRDRPADPGGMQIMGDGTDLDVTGKGEAHLAPEPEQPRPEALAARTAPETPPADRNSSAAQPTDPQGTTSASTSQANPPVPDGSATASPSGQGAAGQDTSTQNAAASLPDTSVQKLPESGAGSDAETPRKTAAQKPSSAETPAIPAPAPSAPASSASVSSGPLPAAPEKPAASPSAKPATGGHMIQLAALGSDADAKATWSKLSKQASDLLSDRTPMIEQKTINGHVFYRLRVGGFDTAQSARAFCVRLHARSIACTPAVF